MYRLWTRPEKEIAIVSHGVVLQHFLYVLENDSADPSVKTGLCRRYVQLLVPALIHIGFLSFSLLAWLYNFDQIQKSRVFFILAKLISILVADCICLINVVN